MKNRLRCYMKDQDTSDKVIHELGATIYFSDEELRLINGDLGRFRLMLDDKLVDARAAFIKLWKHKYHVI